MTATLLSLFSITIGIIGANCLGYFLKKYSFGLIGNTITGVFGSIFLIKTIGRLGFDPSSILQDNSFSFVLLAVNLFFCFTGGAIAVILVQKIKAYANKNPKA